ncbi:hypothetical protein [Acinetobacter venetianus]|uniref:hypothetical protein n=1 Tax=Acinetobacter venetianus TaxID=52133 RepID=UPI003F913DEC
MFVYTILGAKQSKLFYQAGLKTGENFVGQVSESITWGTSFNFDRIKHLKFPITLKGTFEMVSNGSQSTLILHDLALPATESAKN